MGITSTKQLCNSVFENETPVNPLTGEVLIKTADQETATVSVRSKLYMELARSSRRLPEDEYSWDDE